jgi:fibronectin-binding autotransporter adhesin
MRRHTTIGLRQRLTAYSRIAALAVVVLVGAAPSYAQQNLTWDANGATVGTGGTGTWNTASGTWFNGVTYQAWNNALVDNAIFGATAGVVTLGAPITAHNITFSVTGYTVTASTLTLADVVPTITAAAGTTTVASAVTGAAGLTYAGAGSMTLSGAQTYSGGLTMGGTGTLTLSSSLNSYTGVTTINSGVLQVGGTAGTLGATSNIVNNATLTINRTGTFTISQPISGTGSLIKLNTATLVLTGDNTYTGATTISGGILQVGSAGTTGTLGSGNVTINGAATRLQFHRTDTITVGQNITGTGVLFQVGTGTTILTGTNAYAGTTISAGTLQIGAAGTTGTLGTSNVSIAAAGRLVFNRSDTLSVNNLITGAGGITQAGTGTTILLRTNTYTGSTIISAGTLQMGTGGIFGSLGNTSSVVNNGSLVFNRNGSENDGRTIAATISGTGTVTQAGSGTIWLTGTNAYTGATTIATGILSLGRGTATGDLGASSQLVNNGTLQIDRTTDLTVAQSISGTGGLSKLGAAVTTLTGNNTYAGLTSITAGTLRIGNGGSTGTLGTGAVLISAGARLTFERNDVHTAGNAITGAGAVVQTGTGTIILSGDVSHTGGTTINAGTLRIGAGGGTGTLAGDVLNNGALAFDRSGSLTFGGTITGTGAVLKEGPGSVAFTGAHTYSGATAVNAGTLLINGSLTNTTVNVNAGGTLGGTGLVAGPVTIAAGGTIAPGALRGTLTVGSLVLSPGSLLAYELGTPNVVGGPNDLIVVTGDLTLGGTLHVTDVGSFASVPGSYRLIDYGGTLTGTASDLTIGTAPGYAAGDAMVQTVIGGQVNLITSAAGLPVSFWDGGGAIGDGAIAGGSGTWDNSQGNWTNANGTINQAWQPGMAIFTGAPGTVTLGAPIAVRALQFSTDGYRIDGNGQAITLLGMANGDRSLMRVDAGVVATVAAELMGAGGLHKADPGALVLTGNNTYTGGTTISAGTMQIGDGGLVGSIIGDVTNDGVLTFNRADAVTFGGAVSGTGDLVKQGAGILTLTGASTYTGATSVEAGTLFVNGTLGSTSVDVSSGATFGGTGTVAGTVTLASGAALSFGASGGPGRTFTVGALNLSATTSLNYSIGGHGAADRVVVVDNLLLDGRLHISDAGGFGIGVYTLLTYGGTLVDNGLEIATQPGTLVSAVRAGGGQVNLVIGGDAGGPVQFWPGGSGVWNATSTNWTDQTRLTTNRWNGQFAVFEGDPGTVTVEGTLPFTGLQFRANYHITGGSLTLAAPESIVRVDDGVVASISSALGGGGGLVKEAGGTLILSGTNSYTGGTRVAAGVLIGSASSLVGNIRNDATVVFDQGLAGVYAGAMSGTGALVKIGAGTLVLSGLNSYSGGTFVMSGVLQGSASSLTGNIANDAIVIFDQQDAGTYAGVMSGSGALVKTGTGTLVLTGLNSYTGGTLVTAGVLQGSASSLIGNIVNDATVWFEQEGNGVYSGMMSGTGRLVKTGTGTLALTGANSYVGGTVVTAGILLGNAVSLTGNIINDATVIFEQEFGAIYAGQISGTGALVKTGAGTLVLTGANSYTGGTYIADGALRGSSGSLVGDILNDGLVIFDEPVAGTYDGVISGRGALVKIGPGTLTMTGSHTFTGGTLVSEGALLGNSSSLQGQIVNDATVIFDQTFDGTYDGLMSGRGELVKRGNGALRLTGVNTYSGGTLITGGTLQGDTESLQGRIVNDATLVFDQADDAAFRGVLLGSGIVIKEGPGILGLAGDHPFKGLTLVTAGLLLLDGSVGSDVRIGSGAAFAGGGSIGGSLTVLGDVSTMMPDDGTFGELTVGGKITLDPGSRYTVVVDAAGGSSRLITPGHATVGDAAINVEPLSGPYGRVTHYSILSAAGGISGQARASSSVAVLDPWVTSTDKDLVVTLLRTDIPLALYAVTANGAAVGSVVDRLRASTTGDLAAVTRELTALTDQQLGQALDALAGEIHPSTTQLAALESESVADLVRGELAFRSAGASGEGSRSGQVRPWPVGRRGWMRQVSQRTGFDGGSSHGATATLFGLAGGLDWTLDQGWLFGGGGSITQGGMTVASLGSESDLLTPRGFGYLGYTARGWTIQAGAAVGYTAYDTERPITFMARLPERFGGGPLFGGVDRRATSQSSGVAADGWTEVRFTLPFASWALRPNIGLRTARYGRRAWQERGADALSLAAREQSIHSTQADVGLTFARTTRRFRPELSVNYRRELRDGRTSQRLYLVDPSAGEFRAGGLDLANETFMGRVGSWVEWHLIQMAFAYEVRRGSGQTRHIAQVGIGFD